MTISTSTAGPGDYDAPAEEGGGAPSAEASNAEASSEETSAAEGAYWRENIRLLVSLMTIWFVSSFGAGILFGFWFAQQGAIYIFIALICFYVVRMKQIERKYDLDD